MPKLTPKQITILQGVIDGKSYKQIAHEAGINVGNVKVIIAGPGSAPAWCQRISSLPWLLA